jgi:transposase
VERRLHQRAGDAARGRGAEKNGAGSDADEPADHGLGVSRGGFGTKLHVLTDGRGNVLQVIATRGNRNEVPLLGPLLASVSRREGRLPGALAADKGYSADRIRERLLELGVRPVIPMRDSEHVGEKDKFGAFDKVAYRGRNVVERAVAKLKEFRRVATRYEKLASAYCAMLSVANIVLYLRLLDS